MVAAVGSPGTGRVALSRCSKMSTLTTRAFS